MAENKPRFGRVLHVITSLEAIAGAEQSLLNLLRSDLAGKSCVVALKSIEGVASLRCGDAYAGATFIALGCKKMITPRKLRHLRSIMQEFKPDLIVSWMYHGNVAAALATIALPAKVPLLWSVHHGLDRFRDERFSIKLAILVSALIAGLPDSVTYVSDRIARQHRRIFRFAREHNVLPNAVEMSAASTRDAQGSRKTIGIAARYHPIKDYPAFFAIVRELIKLHPGVRVIACGAGMEPGNVGLAEAMRRSGIKPDTIELLGHQRRMTDFYKQLSVLVLTSKSEAFGMVLAEAIHHGVPCASTDVGAAREIIGDAGLLIDSNKPVEAASRILELLEMPLERVAGNCRNQTAMLEANYSKGAIARRIEEIVLGTRRSRM